MNLEKKIEAILFFRNEPTEKKELANLTHESFGNVNLALETLANVYKDRGIVLVQSGDEVSFGTSPLASGIIEDIQKEELSRELGRAGLETLALVLYKGPISRREIDFIRGVNSGFILRTLLIRGLIERSESLEGERSYAYKSTMKLLEYLGVTHIRELPEYEVMKEKLENIDIEENV